MTISLKKCGLSDKNEFFAFLLIQNTAIENFMTGNWRTDMMILDTRHSHVKVLIVVVLLNQTLQLLLMFLQ